MRSVLVYIYGTPGRHHDHPDVIICNFGINYNDVNLTSIAIRLLICGKSMSWPKNLILTLEQPRIGVKRTLGKLNLLYSIIKVTNTKVNISTKKDGLVLGEKSSFKMLRLSFTCRFNWGSYTVAIVKTGTLLCSIMFFPKVVLYLTKSTI